MAANQPAVGPQNNPDGPTLITARAGKQGEQMVSELHARYYEQTYRKNMFQASAVGVTTSAGTSTTYTGLALSNPIGSPVNLVINKVSLSFLVAFAVTSALGIMVGSSGVTNTVHTTPAVQGPAFVGSGVASYGLADQAATLPATPTVRVVLGAGLTGAITVASEQPGLLYDLEGSLILPPGAFMAFYTSTASGASGGCFSIQWEEVPV